MAGDFDFKKEVHEVFKESDEKHQQREQRAQEMQKSFFNDLREMQKAFFNDLKKDRQELSKTINGYIKTDADAIEDEANTKLPKFLRRKFPKYIIYRVYPTDWRILRENFFASYSLPRHLFCDITEFDGLYIITNDDTYDPGLSSPVPTYVPVNLDQSEPKIYQFVVLESKHDLTTDKVNRKIEQMRRFQQYIRESLEYEDKKFTQEFRNKVVTYKLQLFVNQTIHIVFATPHAKDSCIEHIIKEGPSWLKENIHVVYMIPSGNRYAVAFADENFVLRSNVNSSALTIGVEGGGGKKRKSKRTTHIASA